MKTAEPEIIYKDIDADDGMEPMEIESLCMNCHENGLTKLMCTRIPFYKQVIIMSFACEHCGFQNNELQSGEPVQEFGTEIVLNVKEKSDLNRSVIKSEYASIAIPELDLEIPFKSQPGEITTVEGVLMRVKNGLLQDQERRRELDSESAGKVDEFLERLGKYITLQLPWTLKLNDPTGNCYVQNPDPMHVDPRCICSHYYRDLEANKLLALADDDATEWKPTADDLEWKSYEDCKNTVMHFNSLCPDCNKDVEVLMKPTDIPYFQTVIVMSCNCENCGYKSNEVKPGGALQDLGCKIELKVRNEVDLSRDVLKSDTCYMSIPEMEIDVGPGALSGRFTTVEGLLMATKEQLKEQSSFFFGDSAEGGPNTKQKFQDIYDGFNDVVELKREITLILDDPAGNSYIQSLNDEGVDARLSKHFYTRSFDQNEELGLNDMKVENYEDLQTIKEEE